MRKQIQAILEKEPDKEMAAFRVCEFLDSELDLRGNGWFDDDPEFIGWIKTGKETR
jgi:hypothetical protein